MDSPDAILVRELSRMPNVGPATAKDLVLLGVRAVADLKGRDPDEMYDRLCALTGVHHDPCCRDVFAAVIDHAETGSTRPWWEYTHARKEVWKAQGRR
ncbi:MAG: helix-hairpin-helix domain-containing protein [Fimbriimonadaceae bacterium]|nr:helix-hairpin-helix domain-containing protein [Fimbriimonadaceae bacterium]